MLVLSYSIVSLDYLTANDPTLATPLNEQQRADLYAELATGAESGWDYTARFLKEPLAGGSGNTNPALRSLNIRSHVPVDLNSILCAYFVQNSVTSQLMETVDKSHLILAGLYNNQTRSAPAATHVKAANDIKAGVLDLLWDPKKLAFYDFNLTSNSRNDIYTVATYYPLWNGIFPNEILSSSENAFGFFSGLNMVLNRYNGTFPVTFIETGLQWFVSSCPFTSILFTQITGMHPMLGHLTNSSFLRHCDSYPPT